MNTRTTAESRPPYDRRMVGLRLNSMEDQKDKLQAMLIAIRAAAPADDFNLRCLIQVANDIVENHGDWIWLRNHLGVKREELE